MGDRWSLLIVRELLPGPMRYGELMASLGGIATLAERLRTLEAAGVVERRPGRTSGVVYGLTPWGGQLREPIEAFIRWSIPLMAGGRGDDALEPRWLAVALEALLRGRTAKPPAELGIDAAGSFLTLRIDHGGPHVTLDPDRRPGTVLQAEPEAVLRLAAGAITVDQALSAATHASSARSWARRSRRERPAVLPIGGSAGRSVGPTRRSRSGPSPSARTGRPTR